MKFTTVVPVRSVLESIDYESKVICLGSCFSVHMAAKFKRAQFRTLVNPFGILFHPHAIKRLLEYAVEDYVFDVEDVFEHQGIWSCWDAHSEMNQLDAPTIVTHLNEALVAFKQFARESTHLFLTLGTAWVYSLKEEQRMVANCHKVPAAHFDKRILGFEELVGCYEDIVGLVRRLNSDIHICFTISPVRHLKDGFVENQRSKALLIGALHEFLEGKHGAKCAYFPAYEIVQDELRDYRFFERDLLHPNAMAIDYIWERLLQVYVGAEAQEVMNRVDEVTRAMEHRPFNPTSEQHLKFMDGLIVKIDYLLDRYPFMNFRF